LKPDLIVTARGTIAIEMAYFNLPVVALYDNPYVNFSFAHTCNNTNDFYNIIKGKKEIQVNFDKKNIYSFYYQAYIEDLEGVNKELFDSIRPLKLPAYSDEYLEKIKIEKDMIFNSELLSGYRLKL
jgi:hypothetical protein